MPHDIVSRITVHLPSKMRMMLLSASKSLSESSSPLIWSSIIVDNLCGRTRCNDEQLARLVQLGESGIKEIKIRFAVDSTAAGCTYREIQKAHVDLRRLFCSLQSCELRSVTILGRGQLRPALEACALHGQTLRTLRFSGDGRGLTEEVTNTTFFIEDILKPCCGL